MVAVHNALRNPVHSAITGRIVPKTSRDTSASGAVPATSGTQGSATSGASTDADPAADFKSLFGHPTPPSLVTPPVTPKANPTLQSVFGSNPYITNPGGTAPNGVTYSYNPTYFATRATADKLAQIYGGTVVEMNAITPYGPFQQSHANEMIRFPNGNVVNAGILASYYDRGWSQDRIDQAIAGEINSIPT